MLKRNYTLAGLVVLVVAMVACQRDPDDVVDPTPGSGGGDDVQVDPSSFPLDSLSSYGFFTGPLAQMLPKASVLPYDLIDPLFTDYAHKQRFVWMPEGSKATWVSDDALLDFPVGTMLIKTFYYDGVLPANERKILETRLLYRTSSGWEFADYVWNDAQTEATLYMDGLNVPMSWQDDQGTVHDLIYRIPAQAECWTCHKNQNIATPIGPKPRNMARTLDIGGQVVDQLPHMEQVGYLDPSHPPISQVMARWDDPAEPLEDRVRAYLDINCAHCHSVGGHCDYRPMRFDHAESEDPVQLGLCVPPEDPIQPDMTYIVSAGLPERSMMHFRLASTAVNARMPLLGRTVVHEEGLALITEWIESIDPPCP
ncbi:MAG: hypothetical protein R2810_15795 [Flavobacteriales bacterium]|nr:hypothetical protein [Flavobacteriales bacterium]HOP43867.1 hypothetical protein [Flavobacteriales bacterium]HPJ53206.1 hypothetical protein [Flavobacteriales bacterium]HPQ59141.1 hypothetical protein [Flavobacteriales bacterium]